MHLSKLKQKHSTLSEAVYTTAIIEEIEKEVKNTVSQIQDEIDSLTRERERKIGEIPKESYIICEMEGEIVGLKTAKALLEGSEK